MSNSIIAGIALLSLGILAPNLAQAHTAQYNDGYTLGYNNAVNNISIDNGYFNSMPQH